MDARPVRLASAAEAEEYTQRLYPLQDRVFSVAANYGEAFVLTGGTALARCYFEHRYSEDIDLFTTVPNVLALGDELVGRLEAADLEVAQRVRQPGFLRLLVGDGTTRIQVDIVHDPHRLYSPVSSKLGILVDPLDELGAKKVVAYEDRLAAKDAVDLFYLVESLSLAHMIADAERKRVPVDYDNLRSALVRPLEGVALVARPLDLGLFERFRADLAEALLADAKKKAEVIGSRIEELVRELLWDTPPELRTIDATTRPILQRRASQLPLPERLALEAALRRSA